MLVGSDCNNNMLGHATGAKKGADSRFITYDENGGRWDHVVPPVRPDGWGVGVRVPGLIISPFVRKGFIDSHEYETVSILKLIERRYHLAPLAARDANSAVSDLTPAFDFAHDNY